MESILAASYLSLVTGAALVALDLKAQGLTTRAALRTHMHSFRIVTVTGSSLALLGFIGALMAAISGFYDGPMLLVAALPALSGFVWGARFIGVD